MNTDEEMGTPIYSVSGKRIQEGTPGAYVDLASSPPVRAYPVDDSGSIRPLQREYANGFARRDWMYQLCASCCIISMILLIVSISVYGSSRHSFLRL